MSHTFKVSPETSSALSAAYLALNAELEDHNAEWEAKSETWQEGERGTAVSAWLETLGELADSLDSYEPKPEA